MESSRSDYAWRTSPILLTYDIAEQLLSRPGEYTDIRRSDDGTSQSVVRALPNGVSFIHWRDDDRLGGDYTLFWQIEKLR